MKIICRKIFTLPSEFSKQGGKSCTIPGQSIEISELLRRFERGERLHVNIHQPGEMDYLDADVDENTRPEFGEETPEINDITDLENYAHDIKQRKASLRERVKQAKEDAAQRKKDEERKEDDNANA